MTEKQRYTERSSELRRRCHEELRKANRDTITGISAQCLRSDVLLEVNHRRKERDFLKNMPGINADIAHDTATRIDAWLDAAQSIIDGIDAGVFTTVDTLKAAKKNIHLTYRLPMYDAVMHQRAAHIASLSSSVAATLLHSINNEDHPVLETFVPCIEHARETLATAQRSVRDSTSFHTGTSELQTCLELLKKL